MTLRRATKIVATLGPASSDLVILEKMINAGVNVVRLNFSHGTAQDHIDRVTGMVREAAQRAGREVKPSWPICRAPRFREWANLQKAGDVGERRVLCAGCLAH